MSRYQIMVQQDVKFLAMSLATEMIWEQKNWMIIILRLVFYFTGSYAKVVFWT